MNNGDTEYDDEWIPDEDPHLFDLAYNPPAYPAYPQEFMLPDLPGGGDNRHHDGSLLGDHIDNTEFFHET